MSRSELTEMTLLFLMHKKALSCAPYQDQDLWIRIVVSKELVTLHTCACPYIREQRIYSVRTETSVNSWIIPYDSYGG